MNAPKLIEQWLPINEISTEAIRERAGAVPNPEPHQLHVWWARRPLAPSRAVTAGSILPVHYSKDEFLALMGTYPNIHRDQARMADARQHGEKDKDGYTNRRSFTHNPTAGQLASLHRATQQTTGEPNPTVLDVTAGGGSIPFEAGRLGLRTIANELNPVACHILRATCQWPQRHGRPLLDHYREVSAKFLARVNQLLEDVYPDEPQPDCASGHCPHPQRYRCEMNCPDPDTCVHKNIGSKNHCAIRAHRYAQTYLWARIAQCPSCHRQIPLSPNWRLDNKGTGMRLEPGGQGELRIVHNRQVCPDCRNNRECNTAGLHPDGEISPGTVKQAIAICPACGSTTPKGYLAKEAQAGRMGHRLYAIVYRDSWRDKTNSGKDKKRPTTFRGFVNATPERDNSHYIASQLASLSTAWDADDVLPTEVVPVGNDQRPHTYGMEQWVKMFNPRQQLAHGYCVQAFRELADADEDAGILDDCRKAAWGYVAIALDKMINRNSLLTRWESRTSAVVGTFDSHDFGFKWSYAEMIVAGPFGYGLEWSLGEVENCLSAILDMTNATPSGEKTQTSLESPEKDNPAQPAEVLNGDARTLPLDDGSVDCIVFDPPYHDNVCYAELSDFFYVWLKRTAGHLFPEHFTHYLTEKDQEAIASPARFKNRNNGTKSARDQATADYESKMSEIFAECRRVIKPNGIMTVMFTHKSTAAWDALTMALIEAGFSVTRTWPVKTEAESSMHIKDKAAARTTIMLVCRPREENPFPKPWHEVEELIARAVRDDIRDNLSQAGLNSIDLYLSAFGPALRVISEHWETERETRNPDRPKDPYAVTPTDALLVARREVSRHRAQEISREWADNPSDSVTKFYILANDAGSPVMNFDEANLLARAIGASLNKQDPAIRGVANFKGDKVSLLSAHDRLAAGHIGENQSPRHTLDTVHTAVALTGRRNTIDAQQWLIQKLHNPQESPFRATLEALIRTTKPGHDDYHPQRNLWKVLYSTDAPAPATERQGQLL